MRRFDRGFTMTELAIVLVVLGIIAAVAIPHYVGILRDTRAMQTVANIYAVRAAAYLYYGDNAHWPAETGLGAVPPELVDKLPPGFTFVQLPFQLDWENWSSRTFPAGDPRNGVTVGISIECRDPTMLDAVAGLLGKTKVIKISSRRYTLQMAGPAGI